MSSLVCLWTTLDFDTLEPKSSDKCIAKYYSTPYQSFHSHDPDFNSPYCLPYITYSFRSENLMVRLMVLLI